MAATFPGVCAVVPAAGFGRRMQTECPKQYLSIGNKTILEHAVAALLALTDALLGAAALGDIGKLFPDTDPAFKGADSRELLREAWRRIQARGYTLGNVDVTIIAQAPKMLPHIPQMRVFIAEDLGCHMDDVNVKATTTEKLGFTGRGEGIACEAVALLRKADK